MFRETLKYVFEAYVSEFYSVEDIEGSPFINRSYKGAVKGKGHLFVRGK